MLDVHGVQGLVDVRKIPESRRNPQFGHEQLADSLNKRRITYVHMPGLGGLRKPRKDSINTGWKNASFRGYADYMQTTEFTEAIGRLIGLGREKQIAIMCAEAVPWQCHRSLVADALTARDVAVEHIMSPTKRQPHQVTPFAQIENTRVTYPGLIS